MRLAALALTCLALGACSSTDVDRVPVLTPVVIVAWPCSVGGIRCGAGQPAVISVSAGMYPTAGYTLAGRIRRDGTRLRITLLGVESPEVGATIDTPAHAQFELGAASLPETVELALGAQVDRYRVGVVRDSVVLTPVSTTFSRTR